MLMVTFYPLIDGGIDQTVLVFKRLTERDEKGTKEGSQFRGRRYRIKGSQTTSG